jgi:amidophosphoribosyltransferase
MPKKAILTEKQIKFANLLVNNFDNKTRSQCAFEAGYRTRPRQSASELCNEKIYPLVFNYISNLREETKKINSKKYSHQAKRDCLFKLSYIDLEHKYLGKVSTAQKRIEMGMLLAKRQPVKNADCIIPIPETSIFNAQGFSKESKIPLVNAIFKKRPKTQTLFIKNRKERIKNVFLFIPNLIKNKKIVLVDETVISGLSLKTVLSVIRGYKPKEIHVRVVCKPMVRVCPKNDFSKKWKFAPRNYKKFFKVDSFEYLNTYDLAKFANCSYCFGSNKDNSVEFGPNEKKRY